MKRYQMLMLEWDIESGNKELIHEIDTLVGAGVGAGVGALGATGIWAYKRLQLKKKMDACNGNPKCEAQVQDEIESLRNKALLGGAAATVAGAGLGFGGSGMVNKRDRDKKLSDLRADRDDLRQQQIDLQNELEKAAQDRINHSLNRAADQVRHPIRYNLRPELLPPTVRAGLMPVKNPEIEKRVRDAEARVIENERERIANFDKFLKQKERDPWVR